MSFLSRLLKLFTCKSKCVSDCKFNNGQFEIDILDSKLCDFELKNKDIEKLMRVLSKRSRKNNPTKCITDV